MMIYLICLTAGLVFTLVSVVAGHFFGGHGDHVGGSGGHAEAGADSSDMPGISIFSPTIIASFITAFGGFGMIFSEFPATKKVIVSAPLSVVCALAIAGVLLVFPALGVPPHAKLQRIARRPTRRHGSQHRLAHSRKWRRAKSPMSSAARVTRRRRARKMARPSPMARLVKITRVVGTQFYVTRNLNSLIINSKLLCNSTSLPCLPT